MTDNLAHRSGVHVRPMFELVADVCWYVDDCEPIDHNICVQINSARWPEPHLGNMLEPEEVILEKIKKSSLLVEDNSG